MTEITISIKCVNADKATVNIENTATVWNLKQKIEEVLAVPASQQRLIYKGKVMKDDLTLDHYNVQHEHTVHMVKGAAAPQSPPPVSGAATAPQPSQTATPIVSAASTSGSASAPSFPGVSPSPFGGNPFGAFGGGDADINRMQEQLMRSPDMMQQIMNSPMMDNILNNPDLLRNMFLNNPQMQSMLDANPHIRHVLNDPAVLRQSMEMMRNPNAMREAMRNQDLAMSQIENLPGGFNALRRMFEEVQEPMMEAAANSAVPSAPNVTSPNPSSSSNTNSTPTSSAVPNPWGPAATIGATGTNNMNAFGNAFGGLGGNPFMGGAGGGFPGMGGMGGMNGFQQDPAQMAQMMNNPLMQQMMNQMLSDPNMLEQMAAMNPQLRGALQNPQIRSMLTNPEFMRQMMNPANLQAMSQMQQSMQTLQQSGLFGASGGGGVGGFNPYGMNFGNNGINQSGGLNFDSLLAANGLGSSGANPFMGFPPVNNNFNPSPSSATPPMSVDPAVRYAAQLQQLQDMGFVDQAANLRALQTTGGNVNAAVERLLGGN